MRNDYYLKDDTFVIEHYDRQKPFASFLPGIAGVDGIPMWVFYNNRGQGIAGFGIQNKDGAILDFVPANHSYERTETTGFRTFIKKDGKVHEIFSSLNQEASRKMLIDNNAVGFVEENDELNLKVQVSYFTVTGEDYPGLVRKVTLSSLDGSPVEIQMLDGLNTIWPYGTTNDSIKNMSNLATAWFDTFNAENNLPFYRNRSTTDDSAEVGVVEAGHFYGSFVAGEKKPLPIIYDKDVIFGYNTACSKADNFETADIGEILDAVQISANKVPCAYTAFEGTVEDEMVMYSVVGKMNHMDTLNEKAVLFNAEYFKSQEKKARTLVDSLTKDIQGKTAFPMFDAYAKQSYLDNFLRGGYPLVFEGKEGPIVYHVYSRIHGDMEREYNNFNVEPAYYSQGIGNFRDVDQNRRNDVFFLPESGDFSIRQFMEFIQYDGLNPLSVQGSYLNVDHEDIPSLIGFVKNDTEVVKEVLKGDFTPGRLLTTMDEHGIELSISSEDFLKMVMKVSVQEIKAVYGHGYWVDHWTYNMDLIDNYRTVYPDRFSSLMFDVPLRYFLSEATALKREDKYVITEDGRVRQYDAVIEDEARMNRLNIQKGASNWLKDAEGNLVKSSLFEKLLALVINKMVSMDPSGIGVMMNTDKPGWNDAMNGLPGLFGSGTSEVIELNRIVKLLLEMVAEKESLKLPVELTEMFEAYLGELYAYQDGDLNDLDLYERAQALKEAFDDRLCDFVSGEYADISGEIVGNALEAFKKRLMSAIDKAIEVGDGIIPSYFIHEAVDYEILEGKRHPVNGMQNVKVSTWTHRPLPLYLEAPARYMKQLNDKDAAKAMYDKIKVSGMYDEKLGMYITSETLEEESMEIGRARAFTPGWLERESVFMHMEYKYLLGMIKSGLYDEFFQTIKTALPPFMDPSVYGRSTLENSSFIASSVNPNPANHGRGFVSRLTGTTSEMTTMWIKMMTGGRLFDLENGELTFGLHPVLPAEFFTEEGMVEATILGDVKVTYKNENGRNTFGESGVGPVCYTLHYRDGSTHDFSKVKGQYALDIREGKVVSIEVELG